MTSIEEYVRVIEPVEEAINSSTNTLVFGHLIMTLILSVSLKQMWNLLSVMQVLAFMKNFTILPIKMETVF